MSNYNAQLRLRVHHKMLEKSESAKELGELTVIPLGFSVGIAIKLIVAERSRLIDELEAKLPEKTDSDNGFYRAGYNQAITEVKAILEGSK
jgi:hypothetical protein